MLTKNKIIQILILALLGTLSLFLFVYLIYRSQFADIQEPKTPSETVKENTYPDDLTGKVYLTLKEKENLTLRENKNNYGIYSFDLEKNNFQEEYVSENQPVLGGEIDSKTERILVSMPLSEQIHIIDKIDKNKDSLKITNSQSKLKKEAVWSNDEQKIAFMSAKEDISSFDINLWDIVVSDLKGNEEKISTGAHPFFSPDGEKILFLKEDGLNLIDIKTKKEENVLNFEADPTFHLDLSLDKNRLVFSDSLNREINVFKIKSWENFQLEKIYEIETPQSAVSWPKFSPNDNKYLIYEELLKDGLIQLVAYDMENSKRYLLLDLTFYEHSSMWINDWR